MFVDCSGVTNTGIAFTTTNANRERFVSEQENYWRITLN